MSMISLFIIDIDRESFNLVNMRFESLQSLSCVVITVDMSSHKYSTFLVGGSNRQFLTPSWTYPCHDFLARANESSLSRISRPGQ